MTKKKRRPRVADLPPVVAGVHAWLFTPSQSASSHLHGQREAHATWKEERAACQEGERKDSRARE